MTIATTTYIERMAELSGRADPAPSRQELDWAERAFPRIMAADGRAAAVHLIYLKRDLQRGLGLAGADADERAALILRALAEAGGPMTKAEAVQRAHELSGDAGSAQTARGRGYFERPGAARGDSKSLLRRGLVRAAGTRGREVTYELTDEGRAEAGRGTH